MKREREDWGGETGKKVRKRGNREVPAEQVLFNSRSLAASVVGLPPLGILCYL